MKSRGASQYHGIVSNKEWGNIGDLSVFARIRKKTPIKDGPSIIKEVIPSEEQGWEEG